MDSPDLHRLGFDRGWRAAQRFRDVAAAAFLAGLLASTSARAQPPAGQPVAPTREEVERPLPERAEPPRAALQVESDVERTPCALDRPEYQSIRFTLSEVTFDDLRGPRRRRCVRLMPSSSASRCRSPRSAQIRDRAAAILNDAGYVVAIEVPEQRIAEGRIRFQVVMARLVGLRVRGNAGRAERLIASYLRTADGARGLQPLRRRALSAACRRSARLQCPPRLAQRRPARGEVIGEVIVQRIPALVDLTVQNYGSRELGRWGGLLRAQFFGLTGLGDRTLLAVFTTPDFDEQQTLQVAHDFRVGGEGLTFGGQVTLGLGAARSRRSGDRHPLAHPLRDARGQLSLRPPPGPQFVRGTVGLDYIDQDVDFVDIPLNRDRLRVVFARLNGEAIGLSRGSALHSPAEPFWRLGASIEARQGLDIFDASPACGPTLAACFGAGVVPPTRLEADPTATVFAGHGRCRVPPGARLHHRGRDARAI